MSLVDDHEVAVQHVVVQSARHLGSEVHGRNNGLMKPPAIPTEQIIKMCGKWFALCGGAEDFL